MNLDKITKDFGVLKGNSSFSGTFTTSSGTVTVSYGDGTTETSNTPSHVYTGIPPYLLNVKSDSGLVTEIDVSGNALTSFDVSRFGNLTTLDVSNNNLSGAEISRILITLDGLGITGGVVDLTNNLSTTLTSDGLLAIISLRGKGWTIQGFFSPSEISTLAWYDASDASTVIINGSNVTQWSDKNGIYDLSQGTVNDQPKYGTGTINGLNAVEFQDQSIGGLSQDLNVTTNLPTFEYVIVVLNRTFGATFSQAIGSQTSTGGNNYTVQYRGELATNRWQNAYYTDGNPLSNTGADALYNDACIVVHDNLSLTNFPLMVGGDRGINGRGWDGFIGEIICGDETLTTELRQKLEGYLAHKWGVNGDLDVSHPYKTLAP
jgi:hypothetical protein